MVVLLCVWWTGLSSAQSPPVHYYHQGTMPPGAIGSLQLQRGGPLRGYFQPVEIRAPRGVLISLAESGTFGEPLETPTKMGMLIGQVYRLRVMGIPLFEGMEVFPTIEVIDRLYAPRGQERRFPIIIDLTLEDLRFALQGKFITRVIYLEDPRRAAPRAGLPEEPMWFEAAPGRNPLDVADELGRPVAILRMGGRVPDLSRGFDTGFLYGCPPVVKFPPEVKVLAPPPEQSRPEPVPPPAAAPDPTALREAR